MKDSTLIDTIQHCIGCADGLNTETNQGLIVSAVCFLIGVGVRFIEKRNLKRQGKLFDKSKNL